LRVHRLDVGRQRHLRRAIAEFVEHYHRERNVVIHMVAACGGSIDA